MFVTLAEHDALFLNGAYWKTRRSQFHLGALETPRFVCVTNALGEWLLRQPHSGFELGSRGSSQYRQRRGWRIWLSGSDKPVA